MNQHAFTERENLTLLRDKVASAIDAASEVFESQSILQPALDWLEEVENQLDEHENVLSSEDNDEPLSEEEVEELAIWAEMFSECLSEGRGIEEECIYEDIHESLRSALEHLIAHQLKPVRKTGLALYYASIRAA